MDTKNEALPQATEITENVHQSESPNSVKGWWKRKNLRALNLFDESMMNGLQSVSHWRSYFGTPTGATLGIFNAAYPLGGVVGGFFISPVADRFGRRWGLAWGTGVTCLGAALQGTAMNIAMFVIARLIIGMGSVIIAGVGAPYITEIAHPNQRSTATALFLTFYSIGSICAAWATFGTFRINGTASWRIPSALQGLPSLIQLIFVWFVPESPRWLVSKGRREEAFAMLVKYHGEGNATDPLVVAEYHEIISALDMEAEVTKQSVLGGLLELTKSPGNRKRLLIMVWAAICSQMSGNAFVSYYLSPILTSVGLKTDLEQTLINATNQMLSWFTALYFATLPAKLGRRPLFLGSLAAMWIIVICITAGSAEFAKTIPTKPLDTVSLFSSTFSHPPTTLVSTFSFMILSTFAVPIGLENIKWRLYIIFVIWIMVEFTGVWFLFPETKGPSLEEIALIFNGPAKW